MIKSVIRGQTDDKHQLMRPLAPICHRITQGRRSVFLNRWTQQPLAQIRYSIAQGRRNAFLNRWAEQPLAPICRSVAQGRRSGGTKNSSYDSISICSLFVLWPKLRWAHRWTHRWARCSAQFNLGSDGPATFSKLFMQLITTVNVHKWNLGCTVHFSKMQSSNFNQHLIKGDSSQNKKISFHIQAL